MLGSYAHYPIEDARNECFAGELDIAIERNYHQARFPFTVAAQLLVSLLLLASPGLRRLRVLLQVFEWDRQRP